MMKKSFAFLVVLVVVVSPIFAQLLFVHPNNSNLEPLSAFYADMNGAASSYASLDKSTLHNGSPSIDRKSVV